MQFLKKYFLFLNCVNVVFDRFYVFFSNLPCLFLLISFIFFLSLSYMYLLFINSFALLAPSSPSYFLSFSLFLELDSLTIFMLPYETIELVLCNLKYCKKIILLSLIHCWITTLDLHLIASYFLETIYFSCTSWNLCDKTGFLFCDPALLYTISLFQIWFYQPYFMAY